MNYLSCVNCWNYRTYPTILYTIPMRNALKTAKNWLKLYQTSKVFKKTVNIILLDF